MKRLATLISACLIALTGCTVNMMGAAKYGVGYSSTGEAYVYHEVDGDKQDKTAESKLELDQSILDAIIGSDDPDPE